MSTMCACAARVASPGVGNTHRAGGRLGPAEQMVCMIGPDQRQGGGRRTQTHTQIIYIF